ncbi:MAG TPA: hypothetical protein ENN19_11335 [Chloroflexi bacterium]|nr:hypothetical protein [Chloroflexota bacterium]
MDQTAESTHQSVDYRPNLIHLALVFTNALSRIPPTALMPAWLALAAIACWPWGDLRLAAALLALAFTLVDGASLSLLPHCDRSFGPVTPPLLGLTLIRTALFFGLGIAWVTPAGLLGAAALNLAIFAVALYGTWVEPFQIGITRITLRSPKLNGSGPLRLLHLSDLHVERFALRERRLLYLVETLSPDAIVLTGDYLILSAAQDEAIHAAAHRALSALCQIAGPERPIYAISGSPPVDHPDVVPAIFADLSIHWLLDAVADVQIKGHAVRIAGLRCTADRQRDAPRLRRLLENSASPERFTLLLYHSPDLMPEATALGVDLYLCGHTHGGQIRLPFFGAIFTSSEFGKRYEMGCYRAGDTTLYVNRGLGVEGLGSPRARFLSPPEIVLWTLSN